MSSFVTLQSISSRLKDLVQQLSASKLSKDELEEFETLSRRLYERAIILNYKAKEESVYEKSSKESLKTEVTSHKPEIVLEEIPKVKKETQKEEPKPVEESGEIQFDFSGGFDAGQKEPKPKETITPPVERPIEVKKNTPAVEPVAKPEASFAENSHASPSDEIPTDFGEVTNFFYERFSKAFKAKASDRLGTSKIHSLKGAVGLNDKLLFISELFGGNSDKYNESLNVLDQLENSEVALRKLSEIAAQEKWNKEMSAVDEFAHLITRRYVD